MSEHVFLDLDGDVTLEDFAPMLADFERLLARLSRKFLPKGTKIVWRVDTLARSSAKAGFAPVVESESSERVDLGVKEVVSSMGKIAEAMERGTSIPYGAQVERLLLRMSGRINGHVRSITIGNDQVEGTISAPLDLAEGVIRLTPPKGFVTTSSHGVIRGLVEVLDRRGTLHFFVYDLVHDKAVRCILEDGKEDLLRDLWGQYVDVRGDITRDAVTGRPRTVRNIVEIKQVQPARPGAWERARGIWPASSESAGDRLDRLTEAQ